MSAVSSRKGVGVGSSVILGFSIAVRPLALSTRAAQIFSSRILVAAARTSDQNQSLLKNYITFALTTCKAKSFRAPASELIWEFCEGGRRVAEPATGRPKPGRLVGAICGKKIKGLVDSLRRNAAFINLSITGKIVPQLL